MLPPHRLTPTLSTSPTEVSELALPPSEASHSPPASIPSSHLFDLVIIGSGPSALALVARVMSLRPSSLYTEDEHRHLHWLKKSGGAGNESASSAGKLKTLKSGRGEEKILKRRNLDIQENCQCEGRMRILVIDKIGGWLGAWDRAFKEYDIKYLRSPLFFHPSPDLDALLAFSSRKNRDSQACPTTLLSILSRNSLAPCEPCRGRTAKKQASSRFRENANHNSSTDPDLAEIANVVGKEVSKHKKKKYGRTMIGVGINERDRQEYFTPSTKLFRDFIEEDVIDRYGLDAGSDWSTVEQGLVESSDREGTPKAVATVKGEVTGLAYRELHVEGWERLPGFCIETSSGVRIGAKAVVTAVGPGGRPAVPQVFASNSPKAHRKIVGKDTKDCAKDSEIRGKGQGWCHASTLTSPDHIFPPVRLQHEMKSGQSKTICVVGGGLTSAQICDLSLRKGFSKVILVMRGHMKVKPFDVGLEWMGRYSNLEKMRFWQEDRPEARLEMLKSARQGGSITPPYSKLLASHEASGRLEILTNTEISSTKWNEETHEWDLNFKRVLPNCTKSRRNSKISSSSPVSYSPSDDTAGSKEGQRIEQFNRKVNFCVTATGAKLDFINLPFMKDIKRDYPLRVEGGLPVLTEDLQWGKELPLFMVGVASGIQIGPAAGNLGGMREAADRVARRLEELSVGEASPAHADTRIETEGQGDPNDNENGSDDDSDEIRDYPTAFTHFNFEALNTVEVE